MNTYWLVDKTGMKRDPLYVADAAEGSVTSYAYSDSLGSLGGMEDYADAAPYEPMGNVPPTLACLPGNF